MRIDLLLLAVLLPAIIAFGILYRQALPVPYQDDYDAIVAFAIDYNQSPNLKTKMLDLAAKQHNEYKLSFEQAIVASEIELTHRIDFAFLTTLGNLFLLPIGYLLWRTYQATESDLSHCLLEFLPISFLFFSLTYWETLNWAMAELQNLPVIFFSFLAIHLLFPKLTLQPTYTYLLLACLSAVLASCSSANGFLLIPIGLLILLSRRAYAKSLLWCASFAMPLAIYLYHYTSPVHIIYKHFYVTRPLFFLAFLGCMVPLRWVAALLGLALLMIVTLAVRSRFDRINPVGFYFVLWIMATGCLVAWVRGGYAFAMAPRYSIYSILISIFCYAFLAQYLPSRWSTFHRRRFYVTSIVIAVGFCFAADVHAYKRLGERRRMVLSGLELYRANPKVNPPMVDPAVEKTYPTERAFEGAVLTKAIQEHVYSLPSEQKIH